MSKDITYSNEWTAERPKHQNFNGGVPSCIERRPPAFKRLPL